MWGIKMGRQPRQDKVTAMLSDELWEDDETVMTTASTGDMKTMDMEGSDEESDGEEEDRETGQQYNEDKLAYREPPQEPLYNGRGTSRKRKQQQRWDVAMKNKK